ncbi:MAG: FlgD immunoglobulin-like domain containing protein [Calditrichaceae bacterium]
MVDQEGIIRYLRFGVNISDIRASIDGLLATSVDSGPENPISFVLNHNFPNPFNPETTIRFSLDRPQKISLQIFDSRGRLVRSLADGIYNTGRHTVLWDGQSENGIPAASGLYYYRLTGQKQIHTKKMLLIR